MMRHSETLENTMLWKVYQKRISENIERSNWVKKVYETAVVYLKDVRQTFINYTMHDETHVINVLDAMSGLLGDYINRLTVGEMELLILVACLHDLGMVYTEEEKTLCYEDENLYITFLRENCPELLGYTPKDWSENTRQWYLRTLHPFRITEVLQNKEWKDLFDNCPNEIVPMRCILAVCQAHGEDPKELRINNDLEYLQASDVDPLFCALMLRLADLLDFDDTRAPKVLYSYVECNEMSRGEWDKHQASAGFRYPASPSTDELPYKARCKSPMIEHAVRDFLNWIDDELVNCIRLQKYCEAEWQKEFPFPRAVLRSEIESDGYLSGDFCLTMDQAQIMNLLMGENLYDDRDVFVRELLQNAIDATLLRGIMESAFMPKDSRIDIWEWNDKEGNSWFRIDDQGTGMTLGMLQRYFLKVGNSYYTSRELERDLRDHNQLKNYQGISRFGIGFLSCFLCGDYVEVSTLYYDPEKNRREESTIGSSQKVNYGLRLQITGLTGYYTLKSQAEKHLIDSPLPAPDSYDTRDQSVLERHGYRAKPGTSIVIRLNPGKLGALNLRETVEKYLCAARVPVYYNNKRVGRTYDEAIQEIHEMEGERVYELTPELKKKFDDCFPAIRGQYPKLIVTVVPLDTEMAQVLPDFSGVLIKYDVHFDRTPHWKVKDQEYELGALVNYFGQKQQVFLHSNNVKEQINTTAKNRKVMQIIEWYDLKEEYGFTETVELEKKLETFELCPQTEEQLGEVWSPFSEYFDLNTVWVAYQNSLYEKFMSFCVTECGCPNISTIFSIAPAATTTYVYQGIIAGREEREAIPGDSYEAMFLFDNEWKPHVEVSRSKILSMPLEILITICSILNKYMVLDDENISINRFGDWKSVTLREWRDVRNSSLGHWVNQTQENYFEKCKQTLQERWELGKMEWNNSSVLNKYLMAYLQDSYFMTIDYEKGQIVTFNKKTKEECSDTYDFFPPMMFCSAANDQSRKYICHTYSYYRKGITLDHPFVVWLLDNSTRLYQYFQRQFKQIIACLCEKSAEDIIREFDAIRQQLISLTDHHGVDVSSLPQLSMDDFWSEEDEECPF